MKYLVFAFASIAAMTFGAGDNLSQPSASMTARGHLECVCRAGRCQCVKVMDLDDGSSVY